MTFKCWDISLNPLLKTFTPRKLSIGFWRVDFWAKIFFDFLAALGISLALTPPRLDPGLERYPYVSKSILTEA